MIQLPGANGNAQNAFARLRGGMGEVLLRADERQDWINAALNRNILEEVSDDEGNTVLRPRPGFNVDEIGPVVLTPAELDEQGNVITPAVIDTRHHVNLLVDEPALTTPSQQGGQSWAITVILWTNQGGPDNNPNASEVARKRQGVAIIDPETINSQSRVWL